MIKAYYRLVKPGVLYGNVLTVAAGFLLASKGSVEWGLFFVSIIGTTLVIGAACAMNNYLDRDIDSVMERTKSRPSVTGVVPSRNMVIFSVVIGVLGMLILYLWVNLLVVIIGIAGWVVYVWLYGALSKRRSIHGTLVGSVSGAAPILAGYVAVSNSFDTAAILLFVILFIWQMPEFYSIAIYRRNEYKKAKIPVITVVKGINHTKKVILLYLIAFLTATLLLWFYKFTGFTYLIVMSAIGIYWLWLGIKSLKENNDGYWSRKVFHHSLIVLLIFSLLISIDSWLP